MDAEMKDGTLASIGSKAKQKKEPVTDEEER